MKKSVPVEAYQLAEMYALGTPISVYETDFKTNVVAVSVATGSLLLLCLALVFCRVGFSFASSDLQLYGIMIGFVLITGLICTLCFIIPRLYVRNVRVYMCAEGFIYQREHGTDIVRWEHIESVQAGKQFCKVLLKDGTSINFDEHVESLHALGKSIKRKRKELYQVGPKSKSDPTES